MPANTNSTSIRLYFQNYLGANSANLNAQFSYLLTCKTTLLHLGPFCSKIVKTTSTNFINWTGLFFRKGCFRGHLEVGGVGWLACEHISEALHLGTWEIRTNFILYSSKCDPPPPVMWSSALYVPLGSWISVIQLDNGGCKKEFKHGYWACFKDCWFSKPC